MKKNIGFVREPSVEFGDVQEVAGFSDSPNSIKRPPGNASGGKRNPRGPRLLFPGLWVLGFFLLSCASLSSFTAPEEFSLSRAELPQDVIPRWQSFAGETAPGLEVCAGVVEKPRLRFYALRVDRTEPSLEIVVSEKAEGETREGIIPSVRVSSFVRDNRCLGGINANPFGPVSGKEGEDRTISGITVSRGALVAPPNPAYDALVFYRDRGAAILNQGELGAPGGILSGDIENAVGGFYTLLRRGELPDRLRETGPPRPSRHPRSAAGLSADGRTLYLLAIDGRQPGSAGATEAETALILRRLGAWDGLNFDGGGSTSLALRRPDGTVRPVNTPIHGYIPGRERGVASCLGIRAVPD